MVLFTLQSRMPDDEFLDIVVEDCASLERRKILELIVLTAKLSVCNVHKLGTFASLILILHAEQYFTENFWTNSSLASTFANKRPCYFNSGVSLL